VTVVLRSAASVGDAVVLVRDIAALEGGTGALRQKIGPLDVAEFSQGSANVDITKEQLAFRLRLAGIDPRGFRVDGAAHTQVTRASRPLGEDELVTAARQAILQRLPWPAEDVVVEPSSPAHAPVALGSPTDDVRLEAELHPTDTLLGRVQVDVTIYRHGQRQSSVAVYFDVRLYQQVAVATRRIGPGESLTEENIQFDREAVDGRHNYLSAKEAAEGRRALHPLQPGQLIPCSEVERATPEIPVLVKQHDLIKLVAHVGSLRVVQMAEAMQDGRAGQVIRVRNVDSQNIVAGRVVDRSMVEVEY
jgi:flagella basal body P-ring formation protein FlgA